LHIRDPEVFKINGYIELWLLIFPDARKFPHHPLYATSYFINVSAFRDGSDVMSH